MNKSNVANIGESELNDLLLTISQRICLICDVFGVHQAYALGKLPDSLEWHFA